MAKTAYEQLLDLLNDTPDIKTAVQAKLAANPKLIAEDAFTTELFGIYKGAGEPAAEPVTTHVPVVPNTSAPVTSTGDSAAILAALNSLKSSVDDRLKNVMTKDEINALGANLLNEATTRALKQADEISMIRETHRKEFGKELDRPVFEKFVTDAADPATKRNKYATLTDAYDAMVAKDRVTAEIAKGVAEGVKQKTSGATVPGQTTSAALSPAQQVLAKQRAAAQSNNGNGQSSMQQAIDKLAQIERAREAQTVQ